MAADTFLGMALEHYQLAVALRPNAWRVFEEMASLQQSLHNLNGQVEALQKAIDIEPGR